MTLAYSADALIFDSVTDSYALRPDFDPFQHRIEVEMGTGLGWSSDSDAGWNEPDDPQIAHVRDLQGLPMFAGHLYVADRFRVICPGKGMARIDLLEIDHDVVGYVAETELMQGVAYPLAQIGRPYRVPGPPRNVTGFGPGTMIATDLGDLPVEWLTPGDSVLTLDNGPQPLRWAGYVRLTARQMARDPGLRPVRIAPGMGFRVMPNHPLTLAPGTRILLGGADIQLNFGVDHALAGAGTLFDPDALYWRLAGLTYFALLLDRHEVLRANGMWCESLFADTPDMSDIGMAGLLPPLDIHHEQTARRCLYEWETQMLCNLHRPAHVLRRGAAA